ncbi:D-glycero-beta-D-manno-heptose-7-phosphate kinase [bacterium]|nr:D-glycero-beta-D-manno-heptose-7-phosphate kinase [bacterium]
MNKDELVKNIDLLKNPKILIIGDFALDEMVYGQTSRISREAPVLILEHYETKEILGAASNAAHNCSVLNGENTYVLGVVGDDAQGKRLLEIMNEAKINTSLMVVDKTRKTTTKTRISGSCSQSITQQIVRIDRQTTTPLSKETEDKLISNIEKSIQNFDGVILSDYGIGTLTSRVIEAAVAGAKKYNKIIVADIQKNMKRYKGVTAITPNQPDSEKEVGFFIKDEKTLYDAGKKLLENINVEKVLLTRGENGMALFEVKNNEVCLDEIPAFNKKEVFDVTGAGDTVVAVFTLALCAGLSSNCAMYLGNLAASIVVRYFGCFCPNGDILKQEILQN